tara:strand:- start:316 stop:1068 length:753 start_codon:yes stop_codon:yes gene_type:complete
MSYFKIIKLNATSSTNDYIKNKYKIRDVSDGDLVWAIKQTCGRGQRQNQWLSTANESLTFSILREFKGIDISNPFLISLVISLGIHEALAELQIPKLNIKWPNDILSCNKKIGGILIENFFSKGKIIASVIGVGLNLNHNSFENLPHASSLRLVTGNIWDQKKSLDVLMRHLHKVLYQNDFKNLETLIISYNSKLWRRNQIVAFESKSIIFMAKPKGVSIKGNLIIENDEKEELEKNTRQIRMLYNPNDI